MKLKILFISVLMISFGNLFAQTAFDYERNWGTYFGPGGTYLGQTFVNNNLNIDPSNNLNLFGSVVTNNSYTASYYSQFTTIGPAYNLTKPSNLLIASLGSAGNLISSQYSEETSYNLVNSSFDNLGNRYGLQFSLNGLSGAGTAGTWFQASNSSTNKVRFSKFDTNGTLLWSTFLPTENSAVKVIHDQFGNSYICGNTKMQNGLASAGVFQENYEVVNGSGNTVLPNSYIAKLNSNGILEWATYFPAKNIYKLNFYDNNLYVLADSDTNPNGSKLATTGAFQTQKAVSSVTKLSASNGARIWGTYYGPTNPVLQLPSGMITNDSGIYLIGDFQDFSGTNGSYFATPGSFQSTVGGFTDIYLSKFNHSGSRLWSTYFGSPGDEMSGYNDNPIDFIGNDIILTFVQFSNLATNLATPGAYISSPPTISSSNGNYNLMFAKFNENGIRHWSSYYGGANYNTTNNPSISVVAKDVNTFYLYGATLASTGIATEGAVQSTILPYARTGFLGRFDLKNPLSTSDLVKENDLQLYDNPNNGNFTISGSILEKQKASLSVFEMSGKLVHQTPFEKKKTNQFNLQYKLTPGNYLLELRSEKDEKLKVFKMTVK